MKIVKALWHRVTLTEMIFKIVTDPENTTQLKERKSLIRKFTTDPASVAKKVGQDLASRVLQVGELLKTSRKSGSRPAPSLLPILAGLSKEIVELTSVQTSAVSGLQFSQVVSCVIDQAFGGRLNPRDVVRLGNIVEDFAQAYNVLGQDIKNGVTVFGSARTQPNTQDYKAAVDIGGMLADNGFSVITGGGQGIMEAANQGAFEIGGTSVGLRITLPREQVSNEFVTNKVLFRYFFPRKIMLTALAHAFIAMPGGFGTLDEGFEVLTLMQTDKIEKRPFIFYDKNYWKGLTDWLKGEVLNRRNVSPDDLKLFDVVDTPEQAIITLKDRLKEKVSSLQTSVA